MQDDQSEMGGGDGGSAVGWSCCPGGWLDKGLRGEDTPPFAVHKHQGKHFSYLFKCSQFLSCRAHSCWANNEPNGKQGWCDDSRCCLCIASNELAEH
jgi:hypothetical protein